MTLCADSGEDLCPHGIMEKCTMGFLGIATPNNNFILQLRQKMSPDTQHPARVSAPPGVGSPAKLHACYPAKRLFLKSLLLEHSAA